ncbi:MAG: enoyl-CoA hydratase/isomerase family protein [Planctomycetota bacterium]
MSGALGWSVDEAGLGVARLTRPPLNELGEAALDDLERLAATLTASEPPCRALLLVSGLERGFCAGADLRALHAAIEARGHALVAAEVRAFLERLHSALDAIDQAPLAVAAAVHGVCFGGGLELALTADLIVCDRSARFAFPELRLGLIPGFGGTVRLARAVGAARLLDLLLTGRSLNAERAREAGLVSQVVAEGKHEAAAAAALRQTLRLDPRAVAAAKLQAKPLDREALRAERERFLELFARPECARALADFAAREDVLPYLPRPAAP